MVLFHSGVVHLVTPHTRRRAKPKLRTPSSELWFCFVSRDGGARQTTLCGKTPFIFKLLHCGLVSPKKYKTRTLNVFGYATNVESLKK